MSIFYRSEWTCGRYDKEKEVALLYNLIEGKSYFFEDFSAMVIGEILSVGKGGSFSVEDLSIKTSIDLDSLMAFMHELCEVNILLSSQTNKEDIENYRHLVASQRINRGLSEVKTTKQKLPIAISTAEMDYMDKVGGITSVMLELTYKCSAKCIHCYNVGASRNEIEKDSRISSSLSTSDYKRLIDELYDLGLVKICLSGGDPFSNPDVWDIIDYAYNKDIAIDIYTNGIMLESCVNRILSYYPRLIGISIYSDNQDVHDNITRIKGSFNKSFSTLKQLALASVPMEIKCCVMRPNLKSYRGVLDLAKSCGAIMQYEVNVTDSIDGDKCVSTYLRLRPDELEIVLRDDNTPMYVGEEAPNFGGQGRNMIENACGAGYNSFCITPDGWLIPCCAFHLRFGNVKHNSVSEILNNNSILREWQTLTLKQYEECGRYEYCDYCNLCPGNNYSENKTPIKASETNCYMAKARFQLASKLKAGKDPLKGNSIEDKISDLESYSPQEIRQIYDKNG